MAPQPSTRKKGFVFSLDAILATAMATIFILSIYSTLTSIDRTSIQRTELYRISYDLLSAADKNGTLELAVTNTANLLELERAMPKTTCASFAAYLDPYYTGTNRPVIKAARSFGRRCVCSKGFAVAARSVLVFNSTYNQSTPYVAEIRSCYK